MSLLPVAPLWFWVLVPHSSVGRHDEEGSRRKKKEGGEGEGPLMRSAAEYGRQELSSEGAGAGTGGRLT